MEILYLNLDKENNGLPLFSPTPDPNAEYGFYRQEWIRKLANPIISPMKKKAFDGDDFCGVMSMAKAGKFHKLTPSVDEYLCVYALSRRLSLAKNTKELSDILIYKMGFNLTCTLNGIRENFYMREFSQIYKDQKEDINKWINELKIDPKEYKKMQKNLSKIQPQSNYNDFIGCVTQTIFWIIALFLLFYFF